MADTSTKSAPKSKTRNPWDPIPSIAAGQRELHQDN